MVDYILYIFFFLVGSITINIALLAIILILKANKQ